MKKASIILIIALLVIIGSFAGYKFFLTDPATGIPDTIILISMDTTRADHLSCYGYKHKTTPNIDKLAESSLFFEHAFTPVPMTLPAHCSMFTGLIPPTHGVHYNLKMALPDSQLTLTEILKENGYTTYGIISAAVLTKQFGINQGFDVYDDEFENKVTQTDVAERIGDETTEHAIAWLEANSDKKKFMFIHYFDPHNDYLPPAPFNRFAHPYDGEIAFTDHCIGQIIQKLKSLGLYDNALIALVGDHAEMLGEHSETTHSFFTYNNVLRVPMMFKLPGGKAKHTVEEPSSIIDITPTILSLSGIQPPESMQGIDLSNYLDKDFSLPDRPIYSECMTPTMYNGNSLLGVIIDKWHYIQTTRPELYNRITDPKELFNQIDDEPHRARIMQDKLREILETSVRTDIDASIELDDKMIKTLESLGYVSGDVETDFSFDQTKQDPKDLINLHNILSLAQTLIHSGRYNEAIELCDRVIKDHPDLPKPWGLLSNIYQKTQSHDKLIPVLLKRYELTPDDISILRSLSNEYVLTKEYDKAIEISNTILQQEPDSAGTYYILGNIYKHLKDGQKALENYEKALHHDPEHLQARIIIAESSIVTGKLKEALKQYELIVKQDPGYVIGHNSIAWLRATQKDPEIYDPELALIHAQKAAELSEHTDPEILDTLAIAQSANGQFEEAIQTISKAIKICKDNNLQDAVDRMQKSLNLYKQSKPYQP